MVILLAIILYMIISFSTTGGDWFSWYMLFAMIITGIITIRVTKEDRDKKYSELEKRFQKYKEEQGW